MRKNKTRGSRTLLSRLPPRSYPNCLGTLKSFKVKYMKRIERGLKHEATKRELAVARKAQDKLKAKGFLYEKT